MKTNIVRLTWIVVFLSMTLNGLVFAGDQQDRSVKRDEWKQRMETKMQELFNEMNLTDEQKKLLDENKTRNREIMKSLSKAMSEYKEQMKLELQNETLDLGKINQLQSKIKETQNKILDHRLEGILEVHKILSPEQFKKFSDHMQKHRDHFRKRMHENPDETGKGLRGESGEKIPPSLPEMP